MKKPARNSHALSPEWTDLLGARRAALLQRLMRKSGLPPEALLELALEILDLATRKLVSTPITRQAVGLGAARWHNVDAETRSEIMRRAVQARWAKHRKERRPAKPAK